MRIHDVMTRGISSARMESNLAEVAQQMWEHDCGIVPVVNERDEVVGVVTDRDACIALGTRDERASRIRAGDVMSVPVYSCAPEDTLDAALATMRMHRIRRLPVLGIGGVLLGMVSLSDLLRRGEAPSDAIVSALRAVCTSERHVPVALVE